MVCIKYLKPYVVEYSNIMQRFDISAVVVRFDWWTGDEGLA